MADLYSQPSPRPGIVARCALISVLVGASLAGATTPTESASDGVSATYAGERLALDQVGRHHCHDRDYPVIRCFDTAAARDVDLESTADVTMLTSLLYVTFYRDEKYGGPSYSASNPIPNLGAVGWNDQITSFISENGQRPRFYSDAGYVTPSWRWAAGAAVANVGSGANDKISSVQNDP